jgi:hypothetical protein
MSTNATLPAVAAVRRDDRLHVCLGLIVLRHAEHGSEREEDPGVRVLRTDGVDEGGEGRLVRMPGSLPLKSLVPRSTTTASGLMLKSQVGGAV